MNKRIIIALFSICVISSFCGIIAMENNQMIDGMPILSQIQIGKFFNSRSQGREGGRVFPIKRSLQEEFFESVGSGNLDEVKKFVEGKQVDINALDSFAETALRIACSDHKHSNEIIEYLIINGADVNKDVNNMGPIFWMKYYKNEKMVKILLENGAIVDLTALEIDNQDDLKIVKYLNLVADFDKIKTFQDKIQFIFGKKSDMDAFGLLVRRAFVKSVKEVEKDNYKVIEETLFGEIYKQILSDDLEKILGVSRRTDIYGFIRKAIKMNPFCKSEYVEKMVTANFGQKIKNKNKFVDCVIKYS